MFRKLGQIRSKIKGKIANKKAQNTAEYALLIALVVAAIIAMQTYAQRALQARVRDASLFLANETSTIGATQQYEPYYLDTDYDVEQRTLITERLDQNTEVSMQDRSNRIRGASGRQLFTYGANGI